ncbi:MAG TPA: F0F1 ATP synthase subunit epsilon [Thermomicrobiales bacterium]|nr:F0F1 ATP synthase subunit epsilon [Thermomicrobiales bacterium]
MAKLTLEIITGERVVFHQDDVDMVVAPGIEGAIGVLPSHAPLISLLSQGELRVKKGGGEESLVVFGGFIEILDDKVIILADSAERAEEIDLERTALARQNAENALRNRGDVVDLAEAESALRQAAIRERIGQRRRGQTPGS